MPRFKNEWLWLFFRTNIFTNLDGRLPYDLRWKPINYKTWEGILHAQDLDNSELQLAMNLGETYLVTETGNERLGKQKLDLAIL